MKFILELHSRPDLIMTAEQKHYEIIAALKKIQVPWGLDAKENIQFPGFQNEIFASIDLDHSFSKGIKCSIYYRYRNLLQNDSSCDDRIFIQFNTKHVDYNVLIIEIFKQYISLFQPYLAKVYSEQIMFADFEVSRNKNLRKDIFRLYPVNFFDEEYCNQIFKLSIEELIFKLQDKVEDISKFENGIVIILSTKILSLSEANRLSEEALRITDI